MKQQLNEIHRMQQLAGILKENESVEIDTEYNEVNLSSDEGDYTAEIENDGKVSFSKIFDRVRDMNDDNIWNEYAPEIFKKIKNAGGTWEAGPDYVQITTTVDKLKELFPIK